jgi:hypothetical protein
MQARGLPIRDLGYSLTRVAPDSRPQTPSGIPVPAACRDIQKCLWRLDYQKVQSFLLKAIGHVLTIGSLCPHRVQLPHATIQSRDSARLRILPMVTISGESGRGAPLKPAKTVVCFLGPISSYTHQVSLGYLCTPEGYHTAIGFSAKSNAVADNDFRQHWTRSQQTSSSCFP